MCKKSHLAHNLTIITGGLLQSSTSVLVFGSQLCCTTSRGKPPLSKKKKTSGHNDDAYGGPCIPKVQMDANSLLVVHVTFRACPSMKQLSRMSVSQKGFRSQGPLFVPIQLNGHRENHPHTYLHRYGLMRLSIVLKSSPSTHNALAQAGLLNHNHQALLFLISLRPN